MRYFKIIKLYNLHTKFEFFYISQSGVMAIEYKSITLKSLLF